MRAVNFMRDWFCPIHLIYPIRQKCLKLEYDTFLNVCIPDWVAHFNGSFSSSSTEGILGNLFALIVFLSSRTLRGQLTNWYLINQSILDLFVSVFQLLTTATVTNSHVGKGIGAELHCRYKFYVVRFYLLVGEVSHLVHYLVFVGIF